MASERTRRAVSMPHWSSEPLDNDLSAEPPPIAMRPRAKKKKSVNSVRNKPADSEVISNMLDALDSFTPPPSAAAQRHYEVVDGYYDSPHARSKHSRLPSIEDDEGGAPSPVVGSSIRGESGSIRGGSGSIRGDRIKPMRQNSGRTYGDLISAEAPIVPSSKRRSLQSADSESLREQGGFLRLMRTTSMRSRSSLTFESVPSMDSDRSSRHSISTSTLQAISKYTPRPLSSRMASDRSVVQPPTSEPRPKKRKSWETDVNIHAPTENKPDKPNARNDSYVEAGPSRTTFDTRRDNQIPRKPLPNGTADRLDVPATSSAETSVSPTPSGDYSEQMDSTPSKKKKSKSPKSASSSSRTSPLKGPITDAIPERTSSLNQAEKSAADAERRAQRKNKSSSDGGDRSIRKKKKAAQSEQILEELGEEDETVKRIRELKQQREERIRQQKLNVDDQASQVQPDNQDDGARLNNKVGEGSATVESGTKAARATQEPSEPPLDQTRAIGIRDPSRLADNSKAHKMLGLDGNRGPPSPSIMSPLGLNPPPARKSTSTNHSSDREQSRPDYIRSQSADSKVSQMSVRPEYDYAHAVRTLDKQSKPSLDTRRSEDQTMLAGRKPNGSLAAVDKRQNLAVDISTASISRASIDQDVNAFLTSPRLNRTVRHPKTNRIISFSEVGSPTGYPVFVCVGMGLTRFVSAFYDELATTLDLRLITPDRPGVGKSEPYTERDAPGPLSWHQDVAAISAALSITHFSLLAHSAGAIFAMATALVLPHQVRGPVYLLAPWIPPSQFETPSSPSTSTPSTPSNPPASLPYSQRLLRILPVPLLKAANSSFLGLNTNSMTSLPTSASSPTPTKSSSSSKSNSSSPTRKRRPSNAALDPSTPATTILEGELPRPTSLMPAPASGAADAQSPIHLSATAQPSDPDWAYSAAHLSAAEHAVGPSPTSPVQGAGAFTPTSHVSQPVPVPSVSAEVASPAALEQKRLYDTALLNRIWEFATKDSNPANDLLVCLERNREVGFRYTDVRKRVVVVHGGEDRRVRGENVRWLVGGMNAVRAGRRSSKRKEVGGKDGEDRSGDGGKGKGEVDGLGSGRGNAEAERGGSTGSFDGDDDEGDCELRLLKGEGHGLMAVAAVMGDVLSEIALGWRMMGGRRPSAVQETGKEERRSREVDADNAERGKRSEGTGKSTELPLRNGRK
ncbi:alpha/beta hydrolase fold-containing protein 33 [Elsinoe australis]|uniref:Alpha/beta hydrolase fold-containing protein 33 n=1 Tax=Elsinoe australis TaxID=40998 RepID=A0A4U7ATP3_9PEZI|nr:alpha/beta hydrolase fold-containing protein 33 [Elsinoe australis]